MRVCEKAGSQSREGTIGSGLCQLDQLRESILAEVSVASKNLAGDPTPGLIFGIIPGRLSVSVLVQHSTHTCEPGGHSAGREDAEADEQEEDVVLLVQVRDALVLEWVPHLGDGPPFQLGGLHARGILTICEEKHSRQCAETAGFPCPQPKGKVSGAHASKCGLRAHGTGVV